MKRILSIAAAVLVFSCCEADKGRHLLERRKPAEQAAIKEAQPVQPAGNLMQVTCPFCNSTGRMKDSAGNPRICSACGGCGRRFLMDLKEGESLCPRCGGMGKVSVETSSGKTAAFIRCQECSGRGIIKNSVPK